MLGQEILEVALSVPAIAAGAWGIAKTILMVRAGPPQNGNGKGYIEAKSHGKSEQLLEDILSVNRQVLAAINTMAVSEVRIIAAVDKVGDKIDQHDQAVRGHVREAMQVVKDAGIAVTKRRR
jgi:hypothetical protein